MLNKNALAHTTVSTELFKEEISLHIVSEHVCTVPLFLGAETRGELQD